MWGTPRRSSDAALLEAPDDAGFVEVVGGHFHFDAVADGEPDPAFAHFAGDGGQDEMFVFEFDAEHGSGENGMDDAFDFDGYFFHSGFGNDRFPTWAARRS